jgi:hypothetical protein
MPVPKSISAFVSEDQWKALDIDSLSKEDQDVLVRAMAAGFSGAPSPEDLDPEDVKDVLELSRDMVLDFKVKLDDLGLSPEETAAANATSERVIEEMNEGDAE